MRWYRGQQQRGSITVRAHESFVTFSYRLRKHDDEWEDVEEHVVIEWTPCRFGGRRPWFRCPGRGCNHRVGKLFGPGKYFLCRHCYDLAYESQREDAGSRALRKAQKIRDRLGGSINMMLDFPEKPKRMRWQTYWKLRHLGLEAESFSWAHTAARFKIPLSGDTR